MTGSALEPAVSSPLLLALPHLHPPRYPEDDFLSQPPKPQPRSCRIPGPLVLLPRSRAGVPGGPAAWGPLASTARTALLSVLLQLLFLPCCCERPKTLRMLLGKGPSPLSWKEPARSSEIEPHPAVSCPEMGEAGAKLEMEAARLLSLQTLGSRCRRCTQPASERSGANPGACFGLAQCTTELRCRKPLGEEKSCFLFFVLFCFYFSLFF